MQETAARLKPLSKTKRFFTRLTLDQRKLVIASIGSEQRCGMKPGFFCAAISFLAGSASYGNILPPNHLDREDDIRSSFANITEEQFHKTIDNVSTHYDDLVRSHGATLDVRHFWTSSIVNASADRKDTVWIVNLYGGLARRPEMTTDALALVVCHELGHHLAGFPFYSEDGWAASEGQADYFSTFVCAREVWANEKTANEAARNVIDETPRELCDKAWIKTEDQNLCYRIALAGRALATTLAAAGFTATEPSYDTPDRSRVAKTMESHPVPQCRLDTFLQGALCPVSASWTNIPGRSHPSGQRSVAAEWVASKISCTESGSFSSGVRPRCWFAPQVTLLTSTETVEWAEARGDGDAVVEPGETWNLSPLIRNDAPKELTQVSQSILSASPLLKIESGQAVWGDIMPEQRGKPESPMTMTVSDSAKCGQKLSYEAITHSNKLIGTETSAIVLGNEKRLPELIDHETTKLGGFRKSVRKMAMPNGTRAERVQTQLQIDTQAGGRYFSVWLESPQGKAYAIHDGTPTARGSIEGVFEFELDSSNIGGDWRLVVKNRGILSGFLKGWTLRFSDYTCD
ncbi:MAG: proprotein convertase P-domain-containing protein [Oligoflexales bacterium]